MGVNKRGYHKKKSIDQFLHTYTLYIKYKARYFHINQTTLFTPIFTIIILTQIAIL